MAGTVIHFVTMLGRPPGKAVSVVVCVSACGSAWSGQGRAMIGSGCCEI